MGLGCTLFGHDVRRQFGEGRVWTVCDRCGYVSPGLAHDPEGPKPVPVTYKTVAERTKAKSTVVKMRRRA